MYKLMFIVMGLFDFFGNKKIKVAQSQSNKVSNTVSFETQLRIFKELGYKLNENITKQDLLTSVNELSDSNGESERYFTENPFIRLYYQLGWFKIERERKYFTDDCIWYDIEFIDPSTEYIEFMKRMGVITHGEITYKDISIRFDVTNYEWIDFKVNGISKSWKLAKAGHIDASFFQRFALLPQELKTKGRYTYYDDGGQQFVIDYATEEEQRKFIERTKLKREWLGEENHFKMPDTKK